MDDDYCKEVDLSENVAKTADLFFLHGTRFWIQRVLTPIVVSIGLIGNIVTIAVLRQHRMKSSTNTYLTALAISDSLYLCCFFVLSLQHYSHMSDVEYFWYWKSLPYFYWFVDASSGTSIWLTVSFTLERYIAVCHPLRGRILCTESRARKVIACVTFLNTLGTITTPFEWEVCRKSITALAMDATKFGKNSLYKFVYYWFTAFTFCYVPLGILCALNILLVAAVKRSKTQRDDLTQTAVINASRERQENKMTMALVAVVLLFIVCQIPTTILLIISIFYNPPENSPGYNYKRGFGNLCNFLMCINAATNFMLYCAMSDKYRRALVLTLAPPCLAKHRRVTTLSSQTTTSCKSSITKTTGLSRQNTIKVPSIKISPPDSV